MEIMEPETLSPVQTKWVSQKNNTNNSIIQLNSHKNNSNHSVLDFSSLKNIKSSNLESENHISKGNNNHSPIKPNEMNSEQQNINQMNSLPYKLNEFVPKSNFILSNEEMDRYYATHLINIAGKMLEIPQVGIATGQIIFHKCIQRTENRNVFKNKYFLLSMACSFLGGKAEETLRDFSHFLNVYDRIYKRENSLKFDEFDSSFDVIDEKRFSRWKIQLFFSEILVLHTMGHILNYEHPYKFLLSYLNALHMDNVSTEFFQRAWNYLNDILRSPRCIDFSPEVLACSVIHLVSLEFGYSLPLDPIPWHQYFDVHLNQIDDCCNVILSIYFLPKPVDHISPTYIKVKESENNESSHSKEDKKSSLTKDTRQKRHLSYNRSLSVEYNKHKHKKHRSSRKRRRKDRKTDKTYEKSKNVLLNRRNKTNSESSCSKSDETSSFTRFSKKRPILDTHSYHRHNSSRGSKNENRLHSSKKDSNKSSRKKREYSCSMSLSPLINHSEKNKISTLYSDKKSKNNSDHKLKSSVPQSRRKISIIIADKRRKITLPKKDGFLSRISPQKVNNHFIERKLPSKMGLEKKEQMCDIKSVYNSHESKYTSKNKKKVSDRHTHKHVKHRISKSHKHRSSKMKGEGLNFDICSSSLVSGRNMDLKSLIKEQQDKLNSSQKD